MVIPIEPPDMPTAAPNAAAASIVIFGFETMYNPKMIKNNIQGSTIKIEKL